MSPYVVAFVAVVGVLSAVTRLTLTSLLRQANAKARRSLVWGFAALGLAMVGRLPPVYRPINELAGFSLAWPIVFVLTVVALHCFQVIFIHAVHGSMPDDAARRLRKWRSGALLACAAMLIPFLLRPTAADFVSGPSGRFVTGGPGDLVAQFAYLAFGGYVLIASVNLAALARRWAARSVPGGMRTGLLILAGGSALGVVNALHSVGYHVAQLARLVPAWPEAAVSARLVPVVATLQLVGFALPAVWPRLQEIMRWPSYRRSLNTLYPLWAHMCSRSPAYLLHRLRPPLRDRMRILGLKRALRRRIVEIWDVRAVLRDYIPADATARAAALGRQHGLSGDDLEAMLEAARINAGLRNAAVRRGAPLVTDAQTTLPPGGSDLAAEVAWWCKIARACRSPILNQLGLTHSAR